MDRSEYKQEFAKLDVDALKSDIVSALKDSKDWWPADYGHYGPLMCRLAWHAAGTYRVFDGRGGANTGNQRFEPTSSWVDNGNLDKARRLLWPVKKKYGQKISWADLLVLAGNVGMEDMGLKTAGFGCGRMDGWSEEDDVYWGTEESFKDLAMSKDVAGITRDIQGLEKPLGAVQPNIIYVNPEGPGGQPDPLLAAAHMKESFGRMAMGDYETVALVAGGHTFGKAHGAAPAGAHVGPAPCDAPIEEQGLGWMNKFGSGKGSDAITSGLEGAWTEQPARWTHEYFTNLFKYEWELYKSPAGANQWRPKNGGGANTVPDAHDPSKKTYPIMFTTDLALIKDPDYLKISKRFLENPEEFEEAFANAWYKLLHRDMGPVERLWGPDVAPVKLFQDPIPSGSRSYNVLKVESAIQGALNSQFSIADLVRTAWASACTFRHTDFRGGANGARICLAPQNAWAVNTEGKNSPIEVVRKLESLRSSCGEDVSLADMIVLAGNVAVKNALPGGAREKISLSCPSALQFTPGRGDASQEQTDVASFQVLEPTYDAFRNFKANAFQLVDQSFMLTLNKFEMASLFGGMRAIGATAHSAGSMGVLTEKPGVLSNDFFCNLLDMETQWKQVGAGKYEGCNRSTGAVRWTASEVDLCWGSNLELRAVAEHYACDDSADLFAIDFCRAWTKVMNLDRYDTRA